MNQLEGEPVSYEQHMARFSHSFSNLSKELTALQMKHDSGADVSSHHMKPALEKVKEMQTNMLQLRASLKPETSSELNGDTTDVLREVQAVFSHMDGQLKEAYTRLQQHEGNEELAIINAKRSVAEIKKRLNTLFSICDSRRYTSPSNKDVFTVLFDKAVSSPLDTISVIAKSLAEKRIFIPSTNDEFSQFEDASEEPKWYERAREKGEQYKMLYDELRAHMVVDLMNDKEKSTENIEHVLSDLSYRLCGSESHTQLRKNMQNVLDCVAGICSFFCVLKPVLEGMKEEEALDANVMAQMLDAAQPRFIPRDSALRLIEGLVQSDSSGIVKRVLKKTKVATEKQLTSLERNVNRGTPHSKYIGNIRKFAEKYHLASLLPPVIALLRNNDGTLTPMVQGFAEKVIAWGDDCKRIQDIIGELHEEHEQGGEIRAIREKNNALLAYMNRLKRAWEDPDCTLITSKYYHYLQEQIYEMDRDKSASDYDPDELEDYYHYRDINHNSEKGDLISIVKLSTFGCSLMWLDRKDPQVRSRIKEWEQRVQRRKEEEARKKREQELEQQRKAQEVVLAEHAREEVAHESQMINQDTEPVITPGSQHRRSSFGRASALRQSLEVGGSSSTSKDGKAVEVARENHKGKNKAHPGTSAAEHRRTSFGASFSRHSSEAMRPSGFKDQKVEDVARLLGSMDDAKLEALLGILVLLDNSSEGGDLSDFALPSSLE